jgi:hypothetical protein
MFVELDFNNIMIMLLLGIIVFLFMKSEKCINKNENFESWEDDMNTNESLKTMKCAKFSLECCPSRYSNDKGCMCIEDEEKEILETRGYNSVKPYEY